MYNYPTLTLVVLSLNKKDLLAHQLQWLDAIYSKLPDEMRCCVRCLVCDNASGDGSSEILQEFESARKWFSFIVQPQYVEFDVNVLTGYQAAETDYIWLLATDDYVKSVQVVEWIMCILKEHCPSGINVQTDSSNELISPLLPEALQIVLEPCEFARLVQLGGKVSGNIIKKVESNFDAILAPLFGLGYMHLSLQAICFELLGKAPFIHVELPLVFAKQKWGDKNSYHPQYAVSALESFATTYLVNLCPKVFFH
jgi:hypothetical protein